MYDKQKLKQELDAYLAENYIEEPSIKGGAVVGGALGAAVGGGGLIGAVIGAACCAGVKPKGDSVKGGAVAKAAGIAANAKAFVSLIDFDKIFAKNEGETFSDMLMRLIKESGEKNSTVYTRAQLDRQLFSKIKKDKYYHPTKDTAVALAMALKLNLEKTKALIAAAGYALSKSKRDLIITFFIEHNIFDTNLLNDYLYEYEQPILFGR